MTTIQGWPPRYLTPVPEADLARSRGSHVVNFGEAMCRIVKDSVAGHAGDAMIFRDWQKELLRHVFAVREDGSLRHRRALIILPRKNGKSALLSAIALDQLVFGVPGGEIYSCAADREQARIVFGSAKRMVEMEPELSGQLKVFRDSIYNPANGSIYKVLSAEAGTKEGLSPSFTAFDELHAQPNRELWDVMSLAMGARNEPMLFAITTSGTKVDSSGKDSVCYTLYNYGRKVVSGEIDDDSFFMAAWEAPEEMDYRLEETWKIANPGYDDILSAEDMKSSFKSTPEAEFKTKRLDMWVSTSETWLPAGSLEAIASDREVAQHTPIVIGLDGSYNKDCTVLMGCTVEPIPHIFPIAVWENPDDTDETWKVPIQDVEEAVKNAALHYEVLEVICDPYRWQRSMEILEEDGLPIVSFPQNATRMTPATTRMYESILDKKITMSTDPQLHRHFGNATLKSDNRGTRLSKDKLGSKRRIDMAVASVMALERASFFQLQGNQIPTIYDPWAMEGGNSA